MTTRKPISAAEKADQHHNLIVSGLFMFSIGYGLSAAVYCLTGPMAEYVDLASDIVAMVGFVIIIVSVFWKFRTTTAAERRQYFEVDSYTAQMFQKAGFKAWMLTFVSLVMFKAFGGSLFEGLPPEFFIVAVLCISIGAFSIAFFLLNRDFSDDEIDQA